MRALRIAILGVVCGSAFFVCAEIGLTWYVGRQDQALRPSPSAIAKMIDLANTAVDAKNVRHTYVLQDDLKAALSTPSDFTLNHRVSDVPDSVRTAFAKAA